LHPNPYPHSPRTSTVSGALYPRVLTKRIDTDWDGVVGDLERIRAAVVSRHNSVTNLTADAKTLDASSAAVSSFLDALPAHGTGVATEPWSPSLVLPSVNELITVPTQVIHPKS